MTILTVITQTCNGCNASRHLKMNDPADLSGWRTVKNNKHLCPECIDKALRDS